MREARSFLHDLQARNPTLAGARRERNRQSTLKAAVAALDIRREFEPGERPETVIRNGMTFDPTVETRRINLAEKLIRRSDPGPFEDPRYLALLAYQAASIEMALPEAITQKMVGKHWSSILLGTIHTPEINSFEQGFSRSGYCVVCVHSALMEFAYQAAKAVTRVLRAGADSQRLVVVELQDKDIERRVAEDPEPGERLYRTLEAYFFSGYPRAFSGEAVPQQQVRLLTCLIDMTERWVIAHEYSHAVSAAFHSVLGARWRDSPYSEEYFADMDGTILTALSALKLDGMPPDFSLIGGTFALACLEVVRRGLALVQEGKAGPDQGDREHPPGRHRARFIFDMFNRHLIVSSESMGPSELDVAFIAHPKRVPVLDAATIEERRRRIFQFPNALFAIFQSIQSRLQEDFGNRRQLHPMWQR